MRAKQPRAQRIRSRAEIGEILRSGIRWRCSDFGVVYRANDVAYDRFAVLVSKRHGNAVVRNRTKRIYREVFRQSTESKAPHLDILFRPAYQRAVHSRVSDIARRYEQWRAHVEL